MTIWRKPRTDWSVVLTDDGVFVAGPPDATATEALSISGVKCEQREGAFCSVNVSAIHIGRWESAWRVRTEWRASECPA